MLTTLLFISIYFILMEKLAFSISNFYSKNKTHRDFIDIVDVKKIEDGNTISSEITENLNFSNLDAQQMIVILEKNEKLKNDFFKYGLYQTIEEETLNILLNKIKIPFSALDNFVDYLCLGDESVKPSGNKLVIFFKNRKL